MRNLLHRRKVQQHPLTPYSTPCIASNAPTLLLKLAPTRLSTSSTAAPHMAGRRHCGQRCMNKATKGEEKYITPVCVVPTAAMPVGLEAKRGWVR